VTLEWEYDNINRPTRRFTGATTLAEWSYYTSDSNKGLLDWSKAYDSSFGTIEQHYDAYDNGGRVTDQRTIVPGTDEGTFRMQWSYDRNGNLLSMTYPSGGSGDPGETVSYDYNSLGQPDGMTGDDTYVAGADYTYWGSIDTMTLGSGPLEVARNWDYTQSSQPRRLSKIQAGVSGSTTNIADLQFTAYDANGNIRAMRDNTNAGQYQCFEYDTANRLDEAFTSSGAACTTANTTIGVGGYDHSFTYDAIGNLKTRTDVAGSYIYGAGSAGPHAVTSIETGGSPTHSFTYDEIGNQATRVTPSGSQSLDWNADNRLEKVTEGTDSTEFFYDADGNRIVRISPDATTIYIGGIYEYEIDDTTGVNLAPEPGFETSSGWTKYAEATLGLGEATSFYRSNWGIADNYSGSYGRAIANVAYGYLESDAIPVDHGEQYDVSAWIRGEIDADDSTGATDPAWLIRVLFYNSTGGSLGYVDADSGYPSEVSTTYDDKGGTVTAPTGSTTADRAATAKVQLYLFNAQGWVTYDDVSFEDVTDPGVNLVANPGFETSSGWTEVPHAALGEATNFYRGTSGLAAERSGAYGYGINNIAYG
ncbi:MAG: hypothetical protein GY720_22875, partial [bacterium]|nr:hypothetical protein [bacterium]